MHRSHLLCTFILISAIFFNKPKHNQTIFSKVVTVSDSIEEKHVSGQDSAHAWCTKRLCIESFLEEEKTQRENFKAKRHNIPVSFSKEKLYEHSFMRIFYSLPEVLGAEKLVVSSAAAK